MASLIKPGSVKILTKDGEVHVSLTIDLNLNLNAEGISTGAEVRYVKNESDTSNSSNVAKKEEKFEWAIPDFEEAPKINFGKKEV